MINQKWFMQENMQCVAENPEQELYNNARPAAADTRTI